MPFLPYEWNNRKIYNFWEVESFLLKQMLCIKIIVRLDFVQNILHLFMICIFARMVHYFKSYFVFMFNLFEEAKSLSENKCCRENMRTKRNSIQGCIACFSTNVSFLAKILFLIQKNIEQIAACKQDIPPSLSSAFQGIFQCALTIAPFENTRTC